MKKISQNKLKEAIADSLSVMKTAEQLGMFKESNDLLSIAKALMEKLK